MMHPMAVARLRLRPALVRGLATGLGAPGTKMARPSRKAQLQALASRDFDLLVVGGGATGSGIALDAALRGLSVALVERGDYASETSSRSTKLIWAGIRYLATATAQLFRWKSVRDPRKALGDFWGEMRLVLAAHRERRFLLETQAHLTDWLPIAVPVKTWVAWPPPFGHALFAAAPLVLPLVFRAYDALGHFASPPSHVMWPRRARRKFPQLACWDGDDLKYAAVFYEGVHNDARTSLALALTAAEAGAVVVNHCELREVTRDAKTGLADGAVCVDRLTTIEKEEEENITARARHVVFAGGPFTDDLRRREGATGPLEKFTPAVSGAAGTHIVLPGYYAPPSFGMLDINTSDGRFLFMVPWLGSVVVGTTDRKGTPSSTPRPPEAEIEWILREVRKYLSREFELRRSDVKSAWCGWRPLAVDPYAAPGGPASRDHLVTTNPRTGVTLVTGGKWTTYREMAEDVVDAVCDRRGEHRPCTTLKKVLCGGEGYTALLPIRLQQEYAVDTAVAKHLARTYGVDAHAILRQPPPPNRPKLDDDISDAPPPPPYVAHAKLHPRYPYIEAEVPYMCHHEYAVTVADVLALRTRLCYLDKEAALEAAPRVAKLMQAALGWSDEDRHRQLAAAADSINDFGGPTPHDGDDGDDDQKRPTPHDFTFRDMKTIKAARGVAFG